MIDDAALPVLATTTLDQRRASDPRVSAWVSANAGAGKTKVLTDRVLRLLLAGSPPGRILCLTFTKAAAATMAIRVFERLGKWVTLEDADLAADLEKLEGLRPSRGRLRLARRLFARAVETPGGLKIETIHAFCERILHSVPFEANVPARFAVLDEDQSQALLHEATRTVLARAAAEADDALSADFTLVSLECGGEALTRLLRAAVCCSAVAGGPEAVDTAMRRLAKALGVAEDITPALVEDEMLDGGIPAHEWPGLAGAIGASPAPTDQKRAAALSRAAEATRRPEQLAHYRDVFFTEGGRGTPRAETQLVTKKVDPAIKERMLAEQDRLIGLDETCKSARALERTGALFRLATAIRARIEDEKRRLGALDFDDLIARTLALLRREGEAAWILYKLDRGIDHLLVDEAQDTNPAQWEILRRITADFHAGKGAADGRLRTIFAVGDPKQSIYSFQGADPREFESSRRHWRRLATAGDFTFEDVPLTMSFRSVAAVLRAVDSVFGEASHFRGLSFDDTAVGTVHETNRPNDVGQVDLWPTQAPEPADEPDAWTQPVDAPDAHAPPVAVANRVAAAVKQWTTTGDELGHVYAPGEVLILLKKRTGAAFAAVITALKRAGVPVAGADRLFLSDHIGVQDLVAAGRAALLPQDDLTLACALKSPLVGLTDDDLVRIAAYRDAAEPLVDALTRHAADGDAGALRACEALARWRALAARHGPFGFYATLLGPEGGRRALVQRLGSEAGDAVDAFLSLAHGYERLETPSLSAFLAGFEGTERQVKRDPEAVGNEVRVMTVHGAKGLEARLVIVIDGCQVYGPASALIPLAVGRDETIPIWSPGKAADSPAIAAARDDCRLRELEEHNRLLYVAMTRAKDRLVIAPFRAAVNGACPAEAWCEMIRRRLVDVVGGRVHDDWPFGSDPLRAAAPTPADGGLPPLTAVPAWLTREAEPEPEPLPPVRPSSALAAADAPPRSDRPSGGAGRQRGTVIHTLLERLPAVPPERREAVARAFVNARAPGLDDAARAGMVRDALAVLTHPDLGPLFGPGSRAEAPLVGSVLVAGQARLVSGQIDRLAVLDDEVLVADFKTAVAPPAADAPLSPAYVGQLGLYRALLQEIYPRHRIRAFLIWTSGPSVRELDDVELEAALALVRAA
jgi:ATP-dependent helicase/nuclease subunit A